MERGAAILLLGGVALTHLFDLPHKLEEAPYMAALFMALITASVILALLIAAGSEWAWVPTGAICVAAIVGYVISRTVPLPGMADHVGDWLNVDGILALAFELELLSVAVSARAASSASRATYPLRARTSAGTHGRQRSRQAVPSAP